MIKRSLTIIELLLIIVVLIFFLAVFEPVFFHSRPREYSRRNSCASNLRQIGIALNAYADENSGKFPALFYDISSILVGTDINRDKTINGGQSPWRNLCNGVDDSYAKDSKGNFVVPIKTLTVSASLWLLCRNNRATPKMFVCPSNIDKTPIDDPLTDNNRKGSPKYFSDFYTDPSAGPLISYSFLLPYSSNWTPNTKPGYVIGADENNGSNPATAPDQIEKKGSQANSINHKKDGQNVLRLDCSVIWEKSPYVGITSDNIYTALPGNYTGLPQDTPGILSVRPRNKEDTVLIPIQETILTHWDRKP